jgi:hypothetical protein
MRKIFSLLALSLLCACASFSGYGLKPGASEADVRAEMGQPYAEHAAAPGTDYVKSLEYPRGPEGRRTFMARIDAAGKLVRIDQVLDIKYIPELKVGTSTEADVSRVFGRPGQTTGPHRIYGGPIWDYFTYDGQRRIIISVSFDTHGVVVGAGEVPDPSEEMPTQSD